MLCDGGILWVLFLYFYLCNKLASMSDLVIYCIVSVTQSPILPSSTTEAATTPIPAEISDQSTESEYYFINFIMYLHALLTVVGKLCILKIATCVYPALCFNLYWTVIGLK